MTVVDLASETDWPGFSAAIRRLLADAVAPAAVRWRVGDRRVGGGDLFDDVPDGSPPASPTPTPTPPAHPPALHLPRAFVETAQDAFLHADDDRFALLHRCCVRLAADRAAWADTLHDDRLRVDRLAREVRREIHKMHAFVRFRPVGREDGEPRHVAWFEPGHHVVERAAGFFARRFATMRWAILTPRASVTWDGRALAFGPGTSRADAPAADAGEALWLDYYRSIFNPARVKVAMMKKEMPVRFWHNLPEAAAIGPLLAQAPERSARMAAHVDVERLRRRAGAPASGTAEVGATAAPDATPAEALRRLRRATGSCRDCPIADHATQAVFGEGDPGARLMVVGEQPGDVEDLAGRPFQGPAGQLLRETFATLGWDASRLWLTNAVKHFHHELRGKRRMHKTPGQQEAMACLHWLEAEIDAVRPTAIVALGATAARSLLGRPVAIVGNEGRWLAREDGIRVLVCLHPAALLRADGARRADLQARWIDSLSVATPYANAG